MNNERLMVMRNKIEKVGLEDCGVDGGLVAGIIDELIDSRYKIESLTAERDEARKEVGRLASCLKIANDQFEEYERKYYLELNKTEDLTDELAELRKAPGMEEIDALENEYLFTLKTLGHLGSLADRYSLRDIAVKLADIARQAIASRDEEKKRADSCRTNMFQAEQERDEMAGLLKWVATSKVDGLSVMATLMAKSHYGNTDARRILEIVEGK